MDDNQTDDTRDDPDTTNHIKDTPTMDNDKGGDTRGANDSENITEAPTIKSDELDTTRLPTAIVLTMKATKPAVLGSALVWRYRAAKTISITYNIANLFG